MGKHMCIVENAAPMKKWYICVSQNNEIASLTITIQTIDSICSLRHFQVCVCVCHRAKVPFIFIMNQTDI